MPVLHAFLLPQLASDGIKREYTQSYLDTANYTFEAKDGMYVVQQVKTQLEAYFRNKRLAAGVSIHITLIISHYSHGDYCNVKQYKSLFCHIYGKAVFLISARKITFVFS